MDINNSDYIILAGNKGGHEKLIPRATQEIIKIQTYDNRLIHQYCHTELIYPQWVLSDERNCFSSRGLDSPKGVGFKKINFSNMNRWDFLEIPFDRESVIASYALACAMEGQGYDYIGVLARWGLFKFRYRDDYTKWWCSEACAFVTRFRPYKLSPNDYIYQTSVKFGDKHLLKSS